MFHVKHRAAICRSLSCVLCAGENHSTESCALSRSSGLCLSGPLSVADIQKEE